MNTHTLPTSKRYVPMVAAQLSVSALFLLSGCVVSNRPGSASSVSATTQAAISGRVHGGQSPVTGANIQLFAVGSTGDGSAATSLMTYNSAPTTVTTDSNGNFTLTNMYTCPSTPTQVYILSTGGNPGLSSGTNPQISLMAGLGLCSSLSSTQFISINEVTTVATVAALAPFMASATKIGFGTADASAFAAAMALIPQYVNTATGTAPGSALPTGSSASSPALYALANSLAYCVNSAGGVAGDGSNCGTLFAAVQSPFGNAPTDVVGAALDVLLYPNSNVSPIFNLGVANPPFVTSQVTAPSNWTLPVYPTSNAPSASFLHTVYSGVEGAATIPLVVLHNGSTTTPMSVSYSLYNGTAVAGTDFPVSGGTLTWAAGNSASQTINLPIYDPGVSGGSYRKLFVALNTPVGGTLVPNESTQVNITDSDTALTISTTSLAVGTPGTAYSQSLSASGGVGSLTWSLASGSSLPAGLSFSSAGAITGTPTSTSSASTTFVVTDQATPVNQSVRVTLAAVITTGLAYQVSQLPTGTSAQAIKKALLTWGLSMASQLTANGETTAANNLTTDINNDLSVNFVVPTTLPSNLFPTIPSIATNPSVTAEISKLTTQLSTDASTPPTYPTTYTAASSAANDIQLAQQMLYGFLYSGQSMYLNTALIPSIMTRMENGSAAMASFDPDFTTTSAVPLLYLSIAQGWSQLLFPSRQAVWLSQISANQSLVVNGTVGTHLGLGPNDPGNNWINADVKWMEGVAYGALVLGQPQTTIVQGGLAEMAASLFWDGGTNYIDTQNEACEYHPIYATELARYSQVTGDATGFTLAGGTTNYYPLSFEPGNVCEYITAPSNKKYWDSNNGGTGQEIVIYLNGDVYNEYQLANTGYPAGYDAAVYYRTDVTGQALPSSWITYDRNAQGPHGVNNSNGFSYISSTRVVDVPGAPIGFEGLPTFVGGMLVDSTSPTTSWALNGAVERIGNTVNYTANDELNLTDGNFADLAVSVHNAQITTSTFGSVSTIHSLAGYKGSTKSWKQTETWVLLPNRVIGLCSMVNTSAEKAYQLEGAVHFVSGRATDGTQKTLTALSPTEYAYSVSTKPISMVWQVYGHDYANITTEYSSTFSADGANKASNILLNDSHNSATTEYTWPVGTSHYFFSEFRPSTSSPAGSPTILTGLATGLVGFSFTDSGLTYTIVHNPTASAIAYTAPTGTVTMSGTQYRASWIDPAGTQSVASATYAGTIPAYSHIVVVH